MKTTLIKLIALTVAGLAYGGCAHVNSQPISPHAPTRGGASVPMRHPAPAGFVLRSALFGTGTNVVDVTDRVAELLRSEPQGFTARADWLQVDPRPYKRKALVIFYNYKGAAQTLLVTDERVSYDLLIQNAHR